jgi:LmbE family N-acetylglucosaminyl deacetylase
MHLFLFPHPDDEFAVALPLADLRALGIDVQCVYLTGGGYGGQATAPRREESLRVLASLGVYAGRVAFLDFEDGRLHAALEPAFAALREHAAGASAIYFPAWEGGHQDHDAAHLLGLALAREAHLEARQFPLYQGAGLPGPLFRVMAPLPANGPSRARRASQRECHAQMRRSHAYPSQWKSWIGLWPGVAWHLLADGCFHLQAVSVRRVHERPHAGALLFERRGFATAEQFAAGAAPFIARHLELSMPPGGAS